MSTSEVIGPATDMWKAEYYTHSGVAWRVEHDSLECVIDAIQMWTRPRGLSDYQRLAFWGSGVQKPWVVLWCGTHGWTIEGRTLGGPEGGKFWRVAGGPWPLELKNLYEIIDRLDYPGKPQFGRKREELVE